MSGGGAVMSGKKAKTMKGAYSVFLAGLFAVASFAETVVYDDLSATVARTMENTCLVDVSGHSGTTLCESSSGSLYSTDLLAWSEGASAVIEFFDPRLFTEMESPLTKIYTGPAHTLLLFR